MTAGIYCIENLINGKKYVGKGKDVKGRMNQPHKETTLLTRAFKKHGQENFDRKIIFYCREDETGYWEKYFIKELHSHCSEWGYNILWGDDALLDKKTREKINKKKKETRKRNWKQKQKEKYEKKPSISITQLELEKIKEINDYFLEKILFSFLVHAKIKLYFGTDMKINNIFSNTGKNIRKKERNDILNSLCNLGYLERKGNDFLVTYIFENSLTAFTINYYDNVVLYYEKEIEGNVGNLFLRKII